HATVMGGDGMVAISFPDFRIWIEHADQHRAEVLALVAGEVRPDLAAFVKQLVAGSTTRHVERLTGVRVPWRSGEDAFHLLNPRPEIFRLGKRLVREKRAQFFLQRLIRVLAQS